MISSVLSIISVLCLILVQPGRHVLAAPHVVEASSLLQDIIQALKASRRDQSVAEDVVAQGLRNQMMHSQGGSSRPIRKVAHDIHSESDSDSSDSDDA